MTLSERDRRITRFVAVFSQLTASQIHELVFSACKSRTSSDNRLRALVAQEYLSRVELRRLIGGSRGGAGQFVYQLGRRGYQLYFAGEWKKQRNVNYHNLLLADSYLVAVRLQRAGQLAIEVAMTGDDAATTIGGVEIRPDMRLDVTLNTGQQRRIWLEVDMATEGRKQIRDKLVRYWNAVNTADPAEWPEVPEVVWVACDDERARELQWIIDQGKDERARAYFRVTTLAGLCAEIAEPVVHSFDVNSATG